MQGPDQRYRCSAAFQVRPVLRLAPAEPPSYSQLVGIDYSAASIIIGEKVSGSRCCRHLGASLTEVTPAKFEVGATLEVTGYGSERGGRTDPALYGHSAHYAEAPRSHPVHGSAFARAGQSAVGRQPRDYAGTGSGEREGVVGKCGERGLLPRITTAAVSNVNPINGSPGAPVTAQIDLTGILLSTANDAAFLGLSSAGKVIRIFDTFTRPLADQTQLRLVIPGAQAVPPGPYRVILRVNGQQALNSPEVLLV